VGPSLMSSGLWIAAKQDSEVGLDRRPTCESAPLTGGERRGCGQDGSFDDDTALGEVVAKYPIKKLLRGAFHIHTQTFAHGRPPITSFCHTCPSE